MPKKDIWKMLEEYNKKYGQPDSDGDSDGDTAPPPPKPKKKRRRRRADGLLQRALNVRKDRSKYLDEAIKKARGVK